MKRKTKILPNTSCVEQPEKEHDPVIALSGHDTTEFYITILSTDTDASYYTCRLEAKKDARERRRLEWIFRDAKVAQDFMPTSEDDCAAAEYLRIRRQFRAVLIE